MICLSPLEMFVNNVHIVSGSTEYHDLVLTCTVSEAISG